MQLLLQLTDRRLVRIVAARQLLSQLRHRSRLRHIELLLVLAQQSQLLLLRGARQLGGLPQPVQIVALLLQQSQLLVQIGQRGDASLVLLTGGRSVGKGGRLFGIGGRAERWGFVHCWWRCGALVTVLLGELLFEELIHGRCGHFDGCGEGRMSAVLALFSRHVALPQLQRSAFECCGSTVRRPHRLLAADCVVG